DDHLADRLRLLRNHGAKPKYFHKIVGGNFRLDTIQAAALVVKLRHLDAWHKARQQHADRYRELFQQAGPADTIHPPHVVHAPPRASALTSQTSSSSARRSGTPCASFSPHKASARKSTIRCPSTSRSASATSDTRPGTSPSRSALRGRPSRCRCTRS